MSAVPAPSAAVRLPRTVVVRRALLAGLFLAGFVALGFAFGGGAQAADRTAGPDPRLGPTAQATSMTPVTSASAAGAGRELAHSRESAADAVAGSPVGTAVRPVAERTGPAVEKGTEQAGPVARPVTEPVRDVVRDVRRVGGVAALPVQLPGRLPGLDDGARDGEHSGDNGRGDGPGEQPGQEPESRHGSGPQHPGAGDALTGASAGEADAAGAERCTPASASAHSFGDASPRAAQRTDAASGQQPGQGRDGLPGQLPQGPAAAASHTAGDGHGPRGGDQFAAVPAHPAHFGLVPGGVLAAAEPPTRQCAADILEFPG
ncbi:hypothetical protein ACH4FX_18190 [Streptomyces sp. NPDC018019]|uniref:hypothetical protein n=1 Tax=Streptomyces sp. NPDC018019 TaxID=3365030 RepID=UPI0037B08C27